MIGPARPRSDQLVPRLDIAVHQPRSHAGGGAPPAIRHAQWSDTDATLALDRGRCTLHAEPGALTLRTEA